MDAERLRKQLWRERIGFGLVIVALLVVIYLWRSPGPRVYAIAIGDEPKVFLASQFTAARVQKSLRDEFTKRYGENVALPEMKVVDYPKSEDHKTMTESDALEVLRKEVKPQVAAAAIIINGQSVVALPDRAAADEVLRQVKSLLLQREEQSVFPLQKEPPKIDPAKVKFKEKIEIKETSVDADIFKSSVKDAVRRLLGSGNGENKPYVVQAGDTGVAIAKKLHMPLNKLMQLNPGVKWNRLQIGQELNTTEAKPLLTIVYTRELTWRIDVPYTFEEVIAPHLPPHTIKVQRRGQDGRKEITARITYENGREVSRQIIREKILKPSVRQVVVMSP